MRTAGSMWKDRKLDVNQSRLCQSCFNSHYSLYEILGGKLNVNLCSRGIKD